MKLEETSCIFLSNNDDILLIKRSMNKKVAPGEWAAVGGHLESNEINNPQKACIREIYEETGIQEKHINNLKLKYIVLRRYKNDIRIQYVYFGSTTVREVSKNVEGELFWIDREELFNRNLYITTRFVLEHYLEHKNEINDILVGTISVDNNKPTINWSPVQDWESQLK